MGVVHRRRRARRPGRRQGILEPPVSAQHGQASQLRDWDDEEEEEDSGRIWWDDDLEEWRTDFPPPDGFDGQEKGRFGGWRYSRSLTAEELRLVKNDIAAEDEQNRAADEALRDAYFGVLLAEFRGDKDGVPAKTGTQPAAAGSAPWVPAKAGTQPAAEGSANEAGLGSCLRRSTASDAIDNDPKATSTAPHPDVKSSPPS